MLFSQKRLSRHIPHHIMQHVTMDNRLMGRQQLPNGLAYLFPLATLEAIAH